MNIYIGLETIEESNEFLRESLDTSAMLYSDFDESYSMNKINMQEDGLQEAKAAWILQKKEFHKKSIVP